MLSWLRRPARLLAAGRAVFPHDAPRTFWRAYGRRLRPKRNSSARGRASWGGCWGGLMSARQDGTSRPEDGRAAEGPLRGDQVAAFAEQARRIVEAFWQRQAKDGFSIVDPLAISHAFLELTHRLMAEPGKLIEAQAQLWRANLDLWQKAFDRLL